MSILWHLRFIIIPATTSLPLLCPFDNKAKTYWVWTMMRLLEWFPDVYGRNGFGSATQHQQTLILAILDDVEVEYYIH